MSTSSDPFAGVVWHDGLGFGLEGQGWRDLEEGWPASRLPLRAKAEVSEDLWRLSRNGNGLSVAFRTDATDLFARWTLAGEVNRSDVTGGGLDCYGMDDNGTWHWVGRNLPWTQPNADGRFNATPLDGRERLYRVYLPFSVPVTRLEIGVPEEAGLTPVAPRRVADGQGIVYYGTSIVYGAGVSRPGMAHASLLGRWLDQPVVNLGFAGRAWMEPHVAELLAELAPALFVLDPVPNMTPEWIRERMPPFIRILRQARPMTPILWVGNRVLADAAFQPERWTTYGTKRAAAEEMLALLRSEGVDGLHAVCGGELFGADHEGSVDGNHPSDLGAVRMARHLLPDVARLLSKPAIQM
jgi:hypothetical protein